MLEKSSRELEEYFLSLEILKSGMYSGKDILLLAEWNVSEVKDPMDWREWGRGEWSQLGTSCPAGSWACRREARDTGRSADVPCSRVGACGHAGLLGLLWQLPWSGVGSGSRGRYLPGLSLEQKNRRQLHGSKEKDRAQGAQGTPWTSLHSNPKAWCPQASQGIPRKLFEALLGREAHAWADAQPCHTNARTRGPLDGDTRPFIPQTWPLKAS